VIDHKQMQSWRGSYSGCNREAAAEVDVIREQQLKRVEREKVLAKVTNSITAAAVHKSKHIKLHTQISLREEKASSDEYMHSRIC